MSDPQPRLISFYLPQYHPIPENDAWWGRGFTEWTNVGRAKPLFPGHQQPRVPADLGYYDLRLAETRAAQVALAREYGIHGFCYYHYWFNGRRLLERPFNEVLATGSPDFPFCLCWANENWTRAWDGLDREVLVQQHYDSQDDLAHIRWLAGAFRDPRYIRVHGKPLFLVYRFASLPDPMQTVSIWREEARRLGIGELFLCAVESRVGGAQSIPPARLGFDAAVEFQPDGLFFPKPLKSLNDYGGIFDYRAVVERMLQKPAADYLRFPCVTPGWDNSARRRENPTIITGSTPELYEQWLATVVQRQGKSHPGENLIFVNAWNEWGEGAYLEPDQLSGRAYLEATKRVLDRCEIVSPVVPNPTKAAVPQPASAPAVQTLPAPAKTDAPLLSVCIPVYNGNKYLEACLRSVLDQDYRDFELIIVDDCSTQDPSAILNRFPDQRLRFHRNAIRQGLVGNWNRCVELARGRYVCIFHQDDVMQPGNLQRKVAALEKSPSAGFAYSNARVVEEDLSIRHPDWFTPTTPNEDTVFAGRDLFNKLVMGDNLVCCPSAIFRRDLFEQLGRFDPQLPYTADWEMWLRMALQSDVVYLKEPLILYRVHDTNETHRFKGLKELEQSFRAKVTALNRGAKLLPDAPAVLRGVARVTADRAIASLRQRGQQCSVAELRAWLSFAAEAHKASLPEATFDDASNWILAALESSGATLATDRDGSWSDPEEQQFAHARQFEIEGRHDRAVPILERLAAAKPTSVRVWSQLARAQMTLGQLPAAEKSWTVVIAQKSSDWLKTFHGYAMRGSVCEKQGRKADALADFARGVQLALYEGCPDLACELDQWMGLLQQKRSLQQKVAPTKEQARNYALTSAVLQAVGRDLRREGPISSFEFGRANTVWEQLFTGNAPPASLAPQLAGFEAVVAALAKQHLERALERRDEAVQSRILAAWPSLIAIARPGTLPAAIVEFFQQNSSVAAASTEPEVSIIIPTFNRLDMTRRCLESLAQHRNQSRAEIIVVDNASTDGTIAYLESEAKAGRLRAILNRENRGFSQACNQGARAAIGRLVLFLNNDTEVQSGWLDPLVKTLESDDHVVAVGSKLLFPDRTIQHAGVAILDDRQLPDPLVARHIHYRKPENVAEVNQPCTYQALTAACLLVRKESFDQAGGFDEEYWNGYEDIDLCFKLRQEGGLLVYQPLSVVVHHESQSGPERFRQVAHNTKRLHQKWLGKISPDFQVAPDGIITHAATANILPFTSRAAVVCGPPLVSIIILAHDQLEHTRLCLDSIRAHTPLPHELILVDNGSSDDTPKYFQSLAAQQKNVRVITNARNRGFAAGNNQGLAIARGECVLLLNNDTVVTAGWLEKMLAALQRHPDIGIVGPMSNYVAGPQLVKDPGYLSLEDLPRFAAEWSKSHDAVSAEIGRVVGFCLLARRTVIERIGGLDEQFGSGNFEDDDFCLRAGFAGFRVCVAQDAFVHHTGSRTFVGAKIDYRESMLRNWKLFKSKWGMPADAPLENGYRVPGTLPPTAPLKVSLPEPVAAKSPGNSPPAGKLAATRAPIVLPPCALLGHLGEARALLQKKKLEAAWTAVLAALAARPYHPEAALLLAEIALAAGDSVSARQCAQHASQLAPGWKPAKQFLKGSLRGNTKPSWLTVPPGFSHSSKAAPKLTVCLIVKNEEKFLGSCLASIRELASQIVVVDTGSTDRSIEIAKQAGAEVHSFAWTDDFSAARNEALKFATGDWILSLDADEELLPEHRETLLQDMQSASVLACRLPIIDAGRERDGCSYVPRLFRNAPGIFFVGRIHEQVLSSLEVRRREWGLENRLGRAVLRHHGYTQELVTDRNKIERNLRLLKLAVEELPGEPNLLMNLGLELIRSGRPDAGLDRYREAVDAMSALPAAQIVPELRETLLTQYSTHLLAAKRFAEITRLWATPFAKSSAMTASQHFLLGLANMELHQPAAAEEQFRHCVSKRNRPALSPINSEILGAGPQHCLALVLAARKENDAALAAFRQALLDDPNSRPARFDFARFQSERGESVEALKLLHELVAENPQDARVWEFGGQIALSRPEYLKFARDWASEAMKHFPRHPVLVTQRAEALLLSGETTAALALWNGGVIPKSPRQLAAVVACEAAAGNWQRRLSSADELHVSQELLRRCKTLAAFQAHGVVNCLSENLDNLRAIVPSFVEAWQTATQAPREALV